MPNPYSTLPTALFLMSDSAAEKIARLEERSDGQAKTLDRMDKTLDRMATAIDRISSFGGKLDHMSQAVDDIRADSNRQAERVNANERGLESLRSDVMRVRKDLEGLRPKVEDNGKRLDSHAPWIKAATVVSSALIVAGCTALASWATGLISITSG